MVRGGSGFRVQGLPSQGGGPGFRVQGLSSQGGSGVRGQGLHDQRGGQGLGVRSQGLRSQKEVQGSGFRACMVMTDQPGAWS